MGSRRVAPAPPAASRRVMVGDSASLVDPLPFLQEDKRNVEIAQVGVVTLLVLLVQNFKYNLVGQALYSYISNATSSARHYSIYLLYS